MRIAIIGTRGIPNKYGEYEQYAEFLAKGFLANGHEVIVYNSHNHPWQGKHWEGVQIIHIQDPEFKWFLVGRFIYHLRCILNVRRQNCDFLIQVEYATTSVWGFLVTKSTNQVFFMDNLMHKKTNYGKVMGYFLPIAERLAVMYGDKLICDSETVKQDLKRRYSKESAVIPYGAELMPTPNAEILSHYHVRPYEYNLLISKIKKESKVEIILDGFVESKQDKPLIIVTSHVNDYGFYLKDKYAAFPNIRFIGGLYEQDKLNSLRYYSNICLYGNTTCTTNAALLQAMAANALIAADDNHYNQSILGDDALYFKSVADVAALINDVNKEESLYQKFIANNAEKIKQTYSWATVVDRYESHLIASKRSAEKGN